LGPSHWAQIPEHLVMDQHFPKLQDPNVALGRPPELPFGQSRWGFLPLCFHVQLHETRVLNPCCPPPSPFGYG
jgi:hypothetical protein